MSEHPLNFFVGKGGVGKTTVSLAVALSKARQGRKTLYIEIGERSHASQLVGTEPLDYRPRSITRNLWACRITGMEALRDYLLRQLKSEKLYHLLFENRPVRYFFEVAPALRDLMLLGKIVHDLDSTERPGPFDRIVVDAPATGHGLFLLRTPAIVKELTRLGPVFERAEHIDKLLRSSKTTALNVVTLARPLVVTETLDLVRQLRPTRIPLGHVFANRVLLPRDDFSISELRDIANEESTSLESLLAHRALAETREISRIKRLTRLQVSILPEFTNEPTLEFLADWMEKSRGET